MNRLYGILLVPAFLTLACKQDPKPTPGTDITFPEKNLPWSFSQNTVHKTSANRISNKAIKNFYVFQSVSPFEGKEIPRGKFMLVVADQEQIPPNDLIPKDDPQFATKWFTGNVQPLLGKTFTYKKMKITQAENKIAFTGEIFPGKTLRSHIYAVSLTPYLIYYIFIWHDAKDPEFIAGIEKITQEKVKLKAGESIEGAGDI